MQTNGVDHITSAFTEGNNTPNSKSAYRVSKIINDKQKYKLVYRARELRMAIQLAKEDQPLTFNGR